MKVKIEEKEGKLYVKISLRMNEERSKIMVRDIQKILKEKGIQYGKCIQDADVTNRIPSRCSGIFIFETPKPVVKPVVKPASPKTKNRRPPTRRKNSK